MVKVLSLDQKRYFLYVFQGRAGTVVSRPFLYTLLPPSLFLIPASLSPCLSLFPTEFSRSLFPLQSKGKYFDHVVPIVLSQMPELASYALSAPL